MNPYMLDIGTEDDDEIFITAPEETPATKPVEVPAPDVTPAPAPVKV